MEPATQPTVTPPTGILDMAETLVQSPVAMSDALDETNDTEAGRAPVYIPPAWVHMMSTLNDLPIRERGLCEDVLALYVSGEVELKTSTPNAITPAPVTEDPNTPVVRARPTSNGLVPCARVLVNKDLALVHHTQCLIGILIHQFRGSCLNPNRRKPWPDIPTPFLVLMPVCMGNIIHHICQSVMAYTPRFVHGNLTRLTVGSVRCSRNDAETANDPRFRVAQAIESFMGNATTMLVYILGSTSNTIIQTYMNQSQSLEECTTSFRLSNLYMMIASVRTEMMKDVREYGSCIRNISWARQVYKTAANKPVAVEGDDITPAAAQKKTRVRPNRSLGADDSNFVQYCQNAIQLATTLVQTGHPPTPAIPTTESAIEHQRFQQQDTGGFTQEVLQQIDARPDETVGIGVMKEYMSNAKATMDAFDASRPSTAGTSGIWARAFNSRSLATLYPHVTWARAAVGTTATNAPRKPSSSPPQPPTKKRGVATGEPRPPMDSGDDDEPLDRLRKRLRHQRWSASLPRVTNPPPIPPVPVLDESAQEVNDGYSSFLLSNHMAILLGTCGTEGSVHERSKRPGPSTSSAPGTTNQTEPSTTTTTTPDPPKRAVNNSTYLRTRRRQWIRRCTDHFIPEMVGTLATLEVYWRTVTPDLIPWLLVMHLHQLVLCTVTISILRMGYIQAFNRRDNSPNMLLLPVCRCQLLHLFAVHHITTRFHPDQRVNDPSSGNNTEPPSGAGGGGE
jgi:hypothetical protein